MTPDQADMELWNVRPAVRYSTDFLLQKLAKAVRKNLGKNGHVAVVYVTDKGSLVIAQ